MLIGVSLILVSIIILIVQVRDKAYMEKEGFSIGNVKLSFAGVASFLGGLYFLINSF